MSCSQQEIEHATQFLVDAFGDDYPWRWDEQKHLRLSEFASNKKDKIFAQLEGLFSHKWQRKNIRTAPKNLQVQLNRWGTLKDNQVFFTIPATEQRPALLAIWWPWGHGGTVSLRLTILADDYQASEIKAPRKSLFTVLKKYLTR